MPKPEHIPQPAWDKAQELLVTAPGMWRRDICAGGYIYADGSTDGVSSPARDCTCGECDCEPDEYYDEPCYCCQYCYGDDDYDDAGQWEGYVCHSYICHSTPAPLLFDTQSRDQRSESKEEANHRFLHWMLNESPVRNFILNDTLDSLIHGGAIIDCQKAGPHLTLWICKSFRLMYEEPYRIEFWFEMVKGGVHPTLAFCAANLLTCHGTAQYGQTHCSVFLAPKTDKDLKALFVDHLPVSEEGLSKAGGYHNWTTSSVFGGDYEGKKIPVPQKGKKERKPDGWGGWTEREIAPIEDLTEKLLELQKEFVK
jgi:hypothetical protein